jgi:tetratricopeptide (TPR) repeat protein
MPITYQDLLEGRRPDRMLQASVLGQMTAKEQATAALGFALMDLPDLAEKVIASAEALASDSQTQAILLEAKSVRAAALAESAERVETLAAAAVEAKPDAVYSLRLMARICEQRKQFAAAADYYARAWGAYPRSDQTLLDLVRVLIVLRRKDEAHSYLGKARLSLRREVYRLALGRRGLFGIGVAVLFAALILADATYLPAIIAGAGLGALIVANGLRQRDGVALSVGVWLEIVVWVMFGVRLLFLHVT